MSRSRVSSSPRGESDLLQSLLRRDEDRRHDVQLLFQKEQQDKAEKKMLEARHKEVVGGMMGILIKSNGAIAGLESLKKSLNQVDRQQLNHHMDVLMFYRDSLSELMPLIKQTPPSSKQFIEATDKYLEQNEEKREYIATVNQFISRVRGTGLMKRKSKRGKRITRYIKNVFKSNTRIRKM
jgi:hypothetical protein